VAERTCCICRSTAEKSLLVRLVVHEGALVVDDLQRLPGRGAYIHLAAECLSKMGQAQRWERALRVKGSSLEASQVSSVAMKLMGRVNGSAGMPSGVFAGKGSGRKVRL
jgi:predicted RNA-binding protein YlxR (DUF448 family)